MINLIIINFLTLLIFRYIGTNLFSQTHTKIFQILLFICTWLLISIINLQGIGNITISFLLTCIYFFYMFIAFHGNVVVKFLSTTFICLSMAISEFISASLITLIEPLSRTNLSFIVALYFTMILLGLEAMAFIKISKLFLNNISLNKFWSILILPFFTFIMVLGINQQFEQIIQNRFHFSYLFFIVVGIYCSNFIVFNYFLKSLEKAKLEYELKLEREINNNLSMKFNYLNKYYSSKFSFLHDMLHSLNKINKFKNNGNFKDLNDELEKLSLETAKEFKLLYTNSKALGVAINENMEFILQNKIEMHSKIEDDLNLLSFQDQVLFFSELLDYCLINSIEKSVTNPTMIVKIKKMGNHYLVKCSFNYKLNDNDFPGFKDKISQIAEITSIDKCYDNETNINNLMITFNIS